MPTDLFLPLRRQVVSHLKGYAPLTALVSASRIYGERPKDAEPEWPFIRLGLAETEGWDASGLSGSSHPFVIHAFAHGTGGKFTDDIQNISREIVAAMNALETDEYLVECEFRSATTLPEQDEGKFHAVVRFDITIAEQV